MPDNAKFCGECGWTVEKARTSPVALANARKQAKMYRISTIVLAVLCVLLAIGWAMSGTKDPYRSIENYEQEVQDIQRAGVELTGIYVVGEDEELPEGRYNIYPPEGKSYLSVGIYESQDDAKKRYDKDYKSLALDDLHSITRGYKLKKGQVVGIEGDSAFFELVSDDTSAEEGAAEGSTDGGSENGQSDSAGENADND